MSEEPVTTGEAVAVYRQLAEEDPSFRSDLAMSLANLSVDLASNEREEALVIAEAVGICRRLAKMDDPPVIARSYAG